MKKAVSFIKTNSSEFIGMGIVIAWFILVNLIANYLIYFFNH